MKWKRILAIGLSAVTIMSAVPEAGIIAYADTEMEVTDDEGEETDIQAGSADIEQENTEAEQEISIMDENQATEEAAETELTIDTADMTGQAEESAEENIEAMGLFSDDAEKTAEADSEYGAIVGSGTIPDETNSTEITWTVYDSGKLVLGGTGVTPDWSPWFNYKETITDVIIGDGITALGERNFINYPALKTVTIQGDLSKIGSSAFEGCKKLKNITVTGATNKAGLRVLTLGECVFKDCTGLETAEINGNFMTNKNAFEGCTSLRSIKVKESSIIMLREYTFLNCTALTEAELPGSRSKSIGESAFNGCTSLKKFDFSDVSSIGKFAFSNCSSLESMKIPDKITTIAEGAFYGCSGLKSIEIPKNVKTIEKSAFMKCSGIQTLKIPGTVTEIGESAFARCTGLKELDIEEGVQKVADAAFAECSSLKTLILPKSVTDFAKYFVTDYRPITRICYRGTREQWIAAGLNGDNFYNARICFEYQPDHQHQMIVQSYVYPNSCTLPGTRETFCKLCGYVESSEEIPAQGHNWSTESIEKSTCTKDGVTHFVCTRCGEKKDEAIPAGHSFSGWKKTADATVFSAAVETRICAGCGKKETRTTGNRLAPAMSVNVTKFPLQTKQKTKVLKVTGLAKGDSVAAWKSSNTKVAKVSGKADGTCTITAGKKTGKATITVTLKSGLEKKITVTVQKKAVNTTKITGVAKKASLQKGKTLALRPTVTPLTSLQKVTYKSSNKKVATVTSKGVITAKKKGNVKITVKSGKKSYTVKVTVK